MDSKPINKTGPPTLSDDAVKRERAECIDPSGQAPRQLFTAPSGNTISFGHVWCPNCHQWERFEKTHAELVTEPYWANLRCRVCDERFTVHQKHECRAAKLLGATNNPTRLVLVTESGSIIRDATSQDFVCSDCARFLLTCDCQERRNAYQESAKFEDMCLAAATALWKLLEEVEGECKWEATTIAKRRLEHAKMVDGELVWSWQSQLIMNNEPSLPPKFYDVTSAACDKELTPVEAQAALEYKGVLNPRLAGMEKAAGILSPADLIGFPGACRACGSKVASYTANAGLIEARPDAAGSDYWAACTNKDCEHHEGTSYGQAPLEWVIHFGPKDTGFEVKEVAAVKTDD